MSKKLIYIRIVVVTICLLFVCLFILILSNIQKSVNMDSVIEETTVEDRIVFDLRKTPQQQKKKILEYKNEYLKQLYDYTFEDEKFANCLGYDFLSAYDIVDDFKSTYSLKYYLENSIYRQLFYKLFEDSKVFETIELKSLPVTNNYIEHHPNSLKEEFGQYFKIGYRIPSKKKMYDMNYDYLYTYDYGIGCNEDLQVIFVHEDKRIGYVCEDGTSGSLWGKKGSAYEQKELYADLKNIYFKYKLDEKGYLDDVWFDHIEVLANEKELDDSVR